MDSENIGKYITNLYFEMFVTMTEYTDLIITY